MARKYKFPDPKSCKLKDRAVLCTAERMLAIYNQAKEIDAKRISKSVRSWFAAEAQAAGWAGVHFLPEVQSGHGAGCVLFIPPQQINVSIKVTKQTLILAAETE
ncbi:hypothetical protein [Pseudomarimonas arenosa]|uniref:RES domain-containing protein n=1 Tax=Pseudomarimonas arenosa TaxID=2774145 RepID=A0AAW3ZQL9_9GAMM|nr:hypothetical protein [Pseudomarimonas arenosa]MBD8527424.1 hypothetical protein [Pseudomarimonas arenosa]